MNREMHRLKWWIFQPGMLARCWQLKYFYIFFMSTPTMWGRWTQFDDKIFFFGWVEINHQRSVSFREWKSCLLVTWWPGAPLHWNCFTGLKKMQMKPPRIADIYRENMCIYIYLFRERAYIYWQNQYPRFNMSSFSVYVLGFKVSGLRGSEVKDPTPKHDQRSTSPKPKILTPATFFSFPLNVPLPRGRGQRTRFARTFT